MRILLICNYKPGVGGISGQVEILQRHLREEGHSADIFSTKASFLRRLIIPLSLIRKARGYDVMHIHCCSGWGFLPAVVGITVGRRLKNRVVLTYHGGGGELFFEKHPQLVRRYLTRTDVNIVLSGFLARVFENHGIPYTIIPNIIEFGEKQFRLRETLHPHFICTRAHEELYNIPCILRAFQKVLIDIPETTLTLVGYGSQHDALIAMSMEMRLANVTFVGKVDNYEIYHYLDQADIFISAPTIDNMPVSVLEAMNAGLLVISSNVGGVPYIVEDGRTGYLFPSDDSDALAKLMIHAVRQPSEDSSIIHNAQQEVKKYRWENVRQQLYTKYGICS